MEDGASVVLHLLTVGYAERLLGELFLEGSQSIKVTQGSLLRGSIRSCYGSSCILLTSLTIGTLCTFTCTSFCSCFVLERTAVRDNDTTSILVELNNLEGERLALRSLRTISLHKVLWCSESLNAFGERNDSPLIDEFADCTFVNRTYTEVCFQSIPRIFFNLLVAEAKATILLVNL